MIHSIELIKKTELVTTRWSGGTTTQLAIWPKNAVYGDRDFAWRISSAVVEDETSVFTKLPGYWRYLMILEGELDLDHGDKGACHLESYEVDSFSGHWDTTSRGQVRDFNLMHNVDCSGGMTAIVIDGEESKLMGADYSEMKDIYGHLTEAYYGAEGSTVFMMEDRDYLLEEGDLLLLTSYDLKFSFKVRSESPSSSPVLVKTHVLYR